MKKFGNFYDGVEKSWNMKVWNEIKRFLFYFIVLDWLFLVECYGCVIDFSVYGGVFCFFDWIGEVLWEW